MFVIRAERGKRLCWFIVFLLTFFKILTVIMISSKFIFKSLMETASLELTREISFNDMP